MLVTAAIVFVLDLTFETLNKHGVNKIKEVVSANNTVTADNTTSNQTTENTNNETSAEDSQNTENTDNNVEEKCTINKIKGGLKNNVSKRLRYGS